MRHATRLIPILVLGLACAACSEPVELPDELSGHYETSDARYADRYFVLTADTVTLGLGSGRHTQHAIEEIRRDVEEGRTVYTVVYSGEYGPDQLRLLPSPDGRVVFANQPEILWKKRSVEH